MKFMLLILKRIFISLLAMSKRFTIFPFTGVNEVYDFDAFLDV